MFLRLAILSCAIFALVACKGPLQNEIDRVGDRPLSNLSPFESHLEKGYLALAQGEVIEDDFRDTRFFLNRAHAVRQGETVIPTELQQREFTPTNEAILGQARIALVNFLNGGAKQNRPEIAARAQVMFDCWAQELEENRQPNDISRCRKIFFDAVGGLQGISTSSSEPVSTEVASSEVASEVVSTETSTVVVSDSSDTTTAVNLNASNFDADGNPLLFFPYNVHNRTTSGETELLHTANQAIADNTTFVLITTNTDSSGTVEYNDALSMKRGEYVQGLLEKNGIDASIVSIVALGENNLPVATGDGVREPRNRRAKVEFRY